VDAWPKAVSAITLFVEDLARSKAFYQEIFGLSVGVEDSEAVAFFVGEFAINLLQIAAAPELIEPTTAGGPDAGPRFVLSVDVDDVDVVCARLAERGVTLLNGPMDRPWGIRTASFTDPAGHIWEIAHALPKSA
jgi:catechol 2,3-dioxygenase-like lactoylglutathione lyase family enzyme